MLENLKLAVRSQRRIILIFFLTILLPSVFLGVFGIRAIRNERYRLAEQLENEYRNGAEYLVSQVRNNFNELGSDLQNLAHSSSLKGRDYPGIKSAVVDHLANNPLMEFVFIAYDDSGTFFPQFQPPPDEKTASLPKFKSSQIVRLRRAERYEFEQKKYDAAISLYRELFTQSEEKNLKAQMIASIARVQSKKKDYENAIKNYRTIIEDYRFSSSSSGLPLAVFSGLELMNCYRRSGDPANAMKTSLSLFRDICEMNWNLTEAQFKTYCSLLEEGIAGILAESQKKFPEAEFSEELARLKSLYEMRIEQWRAMKDIEQDVLPELRSRLLRYSEFAPSPLFFTKTIGDSPYLIASVLMPDMEDTELPGLVAAKIDRTYLIDNMLQGLIENQHFSEDTNIVVSDLAGKPVLGEKKPIRDQAAVTVFFDGNFPPWKIEFFRGGSSDFARMDLKKSFYFWTIVVLLIVLTFGAVLIMRTVVHEMDVLKIKADFVSSVSHEFKTPLTSMRTLIERIQEGKVHNEAKMNQYISVIAQDTDKLTRLVENVLDFSKIEEGKREFDFEETDMAQLVSRHMQEFQKDELLRDFSIKTVIQEGIPKLYVDKQAFSQALNNLLDNAAKFSSSQKEIHIHVSTDEKNIILDVQDKGIGIPQDEQGKIFEKFYQGKNALKQTVKGAGLGLTLVKHTVEAHGGRVSVKSKVREGTTFTLIFPLTRQAK